MMAQKPKAKGVSSLAPVRFLYRYCAWLERWHLPIVVLSLVATIVAGYYSAELYKNLRTDMEELLPETAQSVKDLKSVMGKVGGLNHLSVVIESSDVEAGRRFQRDVTAKLRELPPTLVARVKDNIIPERDFFEKNKSLYIDVSDWEDIKKYVRDRIRYERKAKNPFSLGLEDEQDAPKKPEYDFDALKKKYADRSAGYSKFDTGYFESRDGRTHVVLAFLPGKVTDIGSNQRLSDAAHKIVADLNPKSYAPDMRVGFSGDVQNVVEEHHGLIEDLVSSFVICTLLVGLSLIVFFRSFMGTYALCAALFAGTAWTFGLSYWVVGYLNANTAFLGSIVVGNGINFGIILLARYFEERRRGLDGRDALPRSVGFTAQATWTAAAAAGLAYASLVLTDFRGFNQFGIIGGIGMAFCWLASFTTLPALLIFFENRGWIRPRVGEARPIFASAVAWLVSVGYKPITYVTLVSIFASVLLVSKLGEDTLESDFSKLRNKEALEKGSGYWGAKVDSVFERYLTPSIILTTDAKHAEKIAGELKKLKERDGAASPISDIKRVDDFLPQYQDRKIELIGDIKELLSPKVMARLSDEDRKLVKELLPDEAPKPVVLSDLPEGVVAYFREMDGSIGRMVHVYPKLRVPARSGDDGKKEGFWDAKEVIRFAEQMRQAIKNAGVPAAIAGQPPLSADMISAIAKDGPKATLFAFLAVVALVIVLFPKFALWRAILSALLLGVLWMGAVMGAYDLKINFLNFIALPITFGIGVDYAVNIFSRFRLEGGRSIARAIESTGGAVSLCSLTTIIGYGSLLLAGSQAFVSFGTLAVLGEVTCLVAAIVALPSILMYLEQREREDEQVEAVPTGKG